MTLPDWPKIETIKAIATYGIAGYVIVKVLGMLSDMVTAGEVDGAAALGIIGALAAGVTAFLFGVEQGKQQQVSQQKAFESGLASPAPGSTTINASGDTNVKGGDPTIVKPGS